MKGMMMMEPEFTNAEVLQLLRNELDGYRRGLVTAPVKGPTKEARLNLAHATLAQLERPGRTSLWVTLFELVMYRHFGLRQRLLTDHVLVIEELEPLSDDERKVIDALEVIKPLPSVSIVLEAVLMQRSCYGHITLVTTEHEFDALEAQFTYRTAQVIHGGVLTLQA